MNEPKAKKEVATKSENTVAVSQPMDLATVMADQGAGLSSHTMDDLAIPFMKILSSMSPQTKKNKTEYIEGATEGMIFNTVSQDLTDGTKGISIVPCLFEPVLLEWTDRGQGSSAPVVQPRFEMVTRLSILLVGTTHTIYKPKLRLMTKAIGTAGILQGVRLFQRLFIVKLSFSMTLLRGRKLKLTILRTKAQIKRIIILFSNH